MARAVVPLNFNAFLEKAKLKDDGSNYTDWVRNLRIILIAAQKNYVLEAPLGARPAADATDDVKNVWQSKADDYSIVQCAMLYGLESGLQRRFERHGAYEMFQELKLIFQANARIERYEVSNKFYSCKMEENSSVSEHILRMSRYNNPEMSMMTDLFDRNLIVPIEIPFDEDVYAKYIEGIAECVVTVNKYPKEFQNILKKLAAIIYPLLPAMNSKNKSQKDGYQYTNGFSNNVNNTLNNMRKNY